MIIFFVYFTLVNTCFFFGSDFSDRALFTLNPLERVLFIANSTYGEITFFLECLGRLCVWEILLLLSEEISFPAFDEAPTLCFSASDFGGTFLSFGGTTCECRCFHLKLRFKLSERPWYKQDSEGKLTIACSPWLLEASSTDLAEDEFKSFGSSGWGLNI